MTTKPIRRADTVKVNYDDSRWALLRDFRQKASNIMLALENRHLQPIVHGSIARGDVTKKSDVDVFLPDPPSSFQVETALESAKNAITARTAIQATPAYAMKAYVELGDAATVSFPLMHMRKVEREFYKFSGELSLSQLRENTRVSGVDKRLMFIEPTAEGHIESSVIGNEEQTARKLGIAVETVLDRVHALLKRDKVGRTGVFVKRMLEPDETFEIALKKLAEDNPAVRRRLKNAA